MVTCAPLLFLHKIFPGYIIYMDLSIFKQPDPSGKMGKEGFLSQNHPVQYRYVIEWAEERLLSDLPFRERLYMCLSGLESRPTCANCGGKVTFVSMTRGYREYCGISCVSSSDKVKYKKTETSTARWGTTSPSKSDEVKRKIIDTNIERYGGRSPMSDKVVKEKSKSTILKNYGVDNPAKSREILDRRVESFKKGTYRSTFTETSLKKYGVRHPWMVESEHDKTVKSGKTKRNKRSREVVETKLVKYPGYMFISVDAANNLIEIYCPKGHTFSTSRFTFDDRCGVGTDICTVCKPINSGTSGLEMQFKDFLSELGVDFESNTRKLIPPYEVDAHVPSRKIAFEFNGLYWHSSANKSPDYHAVRWRACDVNGVRLFTVWEDDWLYRPHIVKSNVRYALGLTTEKIHARLCMVVEIDAKTCANFLTHNHLQGDCRSPVRLGLLYDNKIVSVMTFSRQRLAVSSRSKESSRWELTRFSNLVDTVVTGAASRLLKHFERKWRPTVIDTFSDNSNFAGGLYETLGFGFSHVTKPGYWYLVGGIRQHRFSWRKSVLVKKGADPSKTEEQIMSEMGHPRIYNAGNKKWIKVLDHIPASTS